MCASPLVVLLLLAVDPGEAAAPAATKVHWAFRLPVRLPTPTVKDSARVRTPVDAFLLARLEQAGLTFSPAADQRTLLRRVTYDLTGLPPTPEEMEAFLQDASPDAYVRVVERLLASPAYGERWAQHWLDVVRYADTDGFESDNDRPHAWRYRDYVIKSFNADKGYDRFVAEQLAGDLMVRNVVDAKSGAGGSDTPAAELLIAAGFNRLGPVHQKTMNTPKEVIRQEELTEMTGAVGAALLGLTVACARCHDHKFDPIPQSDYYRLQAFFAGATFKDVDIGSPAEKAAADKAAKEHAALLDPVKKELAALDKPYFDRIVAGKKAKLEPMYRAALDVDPAKRTPEQEKLAKHAMVLLETEWDEIVAILTPADRARRIRLREQMHELVARKPAGAPMAWTVINEDKNPPTHVLKRGDPLLPKDLVNAAFPGALAATKNVPDAAPARDRLELARWMTRPDHPLTARVIVNRLWQHHFGTGLVATGNDFGIRGEPPSHPELLDWLATELPAHGWSLKHLHRLMVLSAAYRQASKPLAAAARKLDPDNRLLARQNRRRLEAESLRDGTLAVAGTLNPRRGGPFVRTPIEPEVYALIFTEHEPDGLWPVTPDPREHNRRSIYLLTKRNLRLPVLEAFDQPDLVSPCPARAVSTFAPQALILLNGPFMQAQSKAFAVRLLREASDATGRIDRAFQLALARAPKPSEREMALTFLTEQADLLRDRLRARLPVGVPEGVPADVDPATAAALADFCLALLNRNEFLYVE